MGARGPGEPPPVVRKRAARQKRKQRQQAARKQARAAEQAYVSQGRAVEKTARQQRTQRQTQQARPLSQRPVRPQRVPTRPQGRAGAQAKPLSPTPVRLNRPDRTSSDVAKAKRGLAVAAYDQLSSGAKRDHLRAAERRADRGKATEGDKAVLHTHSTRVAASRRRELGELTGVANRALPSPLSPEPVKPSRTLSLEPGQRLSGLDSRGRRKILDAQGKQVGLLAPPPPRQQAGSVANLKGPYQIAAIGAQGVAKGLEKAGAKVAANAVRDAAEIAATSPTAVVKTGVDLVRDPGRTARGLVEPYKQLAKDPIKFAKERPVTAALMIAAPARAPGRAAGAAARKAGVQTRARPVATLEGTALREERTGSRGLVTRAVQARADRKRPAPQVTQKHLSRRVDEAYAAGQKHQDRVAGAIMRQQRESPEVRAMPKAARKQHLADYQGTAQSAAKKIAETRTLREFAASKPGAREGHLFTSRTEAEHHAARLNERHPTIQRGGARPLYGREQTPTDWKVKPVGSTGDRFVVVPNAVKRRVEQHQGVGTSRSVFAKTLRQSRGMFTRAVLPYHPTWLSGQSIEGGVRASINRAGPVSFYRAHRLEKLHPEAYGALAERATPGGLIGTAEREMTTKTLHEEFKGTQFEPLARRLTAVGRLPGPKQIRDLHHTVSEFVFEKVNGRLLEGVPQKAQLGRALKQHPLMDRKVLALSKKSMDEMARGVENPETAAALAREVQNSYGKYQAFSPVVRDQIMHWTPFIPWYLNTANFLLHRLPRDHPAAAALVADMNVATDEWRQSVGLSILHKNDKTKPGFMQGGYPVKGSSALGKSLGLSGDKEYILRVGHYTPFGLGADPGSGASSLPLPQFVPAFIATLGYDWKGDELKHPDGRKYSGPEKWAYAATELAQSMIPMAGQVGGVLGTGLEPAPEDRKEALIKQVRPISAVENRRIKPKPKRRRRRRQSGPLPLDAGSGEQKLPLGGGSTGGKLPLG